MIALLLVSPYTLIYYSAHWGLSKRDFAPVQLYLDHFQALHPDLMAHVSRFLSSPAYAQAPALNAIKFWPTLTRHTDVEDIPLVIVIRTTRYAFSLAAGLFFHLEAAGFPRKHLYALLQREVEFKVPSLTAEERTNFQRVRDKVCDHNLFAKVVSTTGNPKGFTLPTDAGEKMVVPVRNCAVEWVVGGPGALVVPMDTRTWTRFMNLTMVFPLWKRVKTDADVAKGPEGMWQMVDFR